MRIATEETRTTVVKAYESGVASREQLAAIFGYSLCTIGRWIREARASGRAAPMPRGHRPPAFGPEERAELASFIEGNPDATLEEMRERFGKGCSLAAVSKTVKRLGYVFKKNPAGKRAGQGGRGGGPRRLAVVPGGGGGAAAGVPRRVRRKDGHGGLYGRPLGGSRCRGRAPAGHWGRVTVLSAMRLDGTTESVVFEGATNRAIFDEYIRQVLAPTLEPGDILVLDNLSVHKSAALREAVSARGAEVRFLPAYSPDLNPIEKMWSKMKQALRGIGARTKEDLFSAVGVALGMVTESDAQGWFRSCGYIASQY
jgi:transposase